MKAAKWRVLRFRKNQPEHNLLAAARHYIKAHGGTAFVIGGIEIQKWPEDPEFTYRVAVRVTGKRPEVKSEQNK